MPAPEQRSDSYQLAFHRRWHDLQDPHVRALAWLLESPDLLDPHASHWHGQIATLESSDDDATGKWLRQLDQAPSDLHAALAVQPLTRLGRYAENLMAFYFRHEDILVAHGLQVRANKNNTIGEFDFLLRHGQALVHWEFATKLYLLEPTGTGAAADYFVGPNLMDTLGAKMRKILSQQLSLAQHPAAQQHLPQPVTRAQALIKGWLFYHHHHAQSVESIGVSPTHCRGFWCELTEFDQLEIEHAVILPRLSWLAPAKVEFDQMLMRAALKDQLVSHFTHDSMPVLIGILQVQDNVAIEIDRGFIVPNDWRTRAGQRLRKPGLAAH